MKKSDIYIAIEKFEKAIASLREGVNQTNTDLERDGTIQRFGFTVVVFVITLTRIDT